MTMKPWPPTRRAFLGGAGATVAASVPSSAPARPKVSALFAGRMDDAGFMEAGHRGLLAARGRLGVDLSYLDGVAR